MLEFTTLISGLSYTEYPRWRDGRLYISDFYTQRILAVAMDGEGRAHDQKRRDRGAANASLLREVYYNLNAT
jgi:hypothetical protein